MSNGKTTKHKAIGIASGIFTLVALLVGLFHSSINSPSPAQYRWFDVLYLYQTAVATGLLHLNYPLAFSNFVQNFAWSFALFRSNSMQNSINSMRNKTGGHLDGNSYSDVQYINRKLSPYNFKSVNLNTVHTPAQLSSLFAESPKAIAGQSLVSRAQLPSALYSNETNEINTGIPVYVNSLSIPPANAFTTIFFFFLTFIAIALVFHALLFAAVLICDRAAGERKVNWATRLRRMWWDYCMGNALRVVSLSLCKVASFTADPQCLIWFLPIWIFGFYQFKIGDSKLAIFFAVLAILLTLVPLAVAFVLSFLRVRRPSSTAPTISPLYTSYRWFHSVGMLYRPYRQRFHFFWFAPLVLAMIVRSAFIAFGPARAWAQVIGNIVVELIVLVLLIACRPHKDRKGDWLAPFLSLCRLIAFGLLIAFIPSLGVDAIVRTVIGIVEIAVFGIPTVLLFFGLIWNAGYGYLWRRHTHRIEDGLEVERFVASDDDSQVREAMAHVDADRFVTGPGALHSRSLQGGDADSGPSLNRRTSIMEPVETVYEPSSSGEWKDSTMDKDLSAAAYQNAAAGRHSIGEKSNYAAATYRAGSQPQSEYEYTGRNDVYSPQNSNEVGGATAYGYGKY